MDNNDVCSNADLCTAKFIYDGLTIKNSQGDTFDTSDYDGVKAVVV